MVWSKLYAWCARLRASAFDARRTLALVWASSPAQAIALAGLTLASGLAPLGVAEAAKAIVDAIVARNAAEATRWVMVELACVTALASSERALELVRSLLGARLGLDIHAEILNKAQRLELTTFEGPDYRDRLLRAQTEASTRPIALVLESFRIVQSLTTLSGYAVVAARFSPWAVLGLAVATLPVTIAEVHFSRLTFGVHNERSPESRRMLYLEYLLSDDKHAKEVRLFDVGAVLLDRHARLGERLYRRDRRLAIRRAGWTQALSLLGTSAIYAAYAAMAATAAAGRLSLGSVTLYVLALRQGQVAFQCALGAIGHVYEHGLYMSNLWAYLDLPSAGPSDASSTAREPRTPQRGGPVTEGLVLDDVGFRYPGATRWALRHVDLVIRPGDSVSLVGENGAGKTTLVKLITRLYEPSEGRILLDGRDVLDWDPERLRRRFGVIFQDFNRYMLSMRDNVSIGCLEHGPDDARVARAIERAGATEVAASLDHGIDTQLGHVFEGGAELSGGQWQKIALARAFMREEADILILDEPTAALDAEAEHRVFERFQRLAAGRTAIVISHRFPTVRMARQIVVLDAGRVRETGTHEELVSKAGRYARMFQLQSEGYR